MAEKLSRRDFLKVAGLGTASLAGAALGGFASKEIGVGVGGGFWSEGAYFIPVYENHSTGAGYKKLPENVAGVFMEYNIPYWNYEGETYNLFNLPLPELINIISTRKQDRQTLDSVSRAQGVIGMGDIVSSEFEAFKYIKFKSEEDRKLFWKGIAVAAASAMPESLEIARQKSKKQDLAMTRRHFLSLASSLSGGAFGVWLATKTAYFEDNTIMKGVKQDPFNRFLVRLHGVISNFHPEDPFVFTRNAVMAAKIKTLGRHLQKVNDHPIVGFQVGAFHSGIEDMVSLPKEVLAAVIMNLNEKYMKRVRYTYKDHFKMLRMFKAQDNNFYDLPPIKAF